MATSIQIIENMANGKKYMAFLVFGTENSKILKMPPNNKNGRNMINSNLFIFLKKT